MPKIEAWKCPHTKKLFEEEKTYKAHLKRLSRQRIAQRKWKEIRTSVNSVIAGAQEVASAQELVDYIVANQQAFMIYGTFNDSSDNSKLHEAMEKGWKIKFPILRKVEIKTKWRLDVSNSHNCPRDGYTNWGGNNKDPDKQERHYPGWHGRIGIAYDKDDMHLIITKSNKQTFKIEAPTISDMGAGFGHSASLSGICTGSGGGGLENNSYEVSLFQSDFPLWAEAVTWAIVSSDGEKPHWGNSPVYKELDALGVGSYEYE